MNARAAKAQSADYHETRPDAPAALVVFDELKQGPSMIVPTVVFI